ncbi:MAG: DNA primase [Candidatus Hydrogenedentes bacterium]|nr:DNA primase [Candidatus Hydrogenedentota bacterium]
MDNGGRVRLHISQAVIDRVRARTDIVELVGQYVELRRAGDNYRGLCPFHNEKTPSFNVNQSRQIFHCFGCGRGGDVFKFLMLHDGLTFSESLRTLAERAGIELEPETPRTAQQRAERTKLTELNAFAARFFRNCAKENAYRPKVEAYLRKRGISAETAERFMLGYAPLLWTHCTDAAAKQGFTREVIERSGLGKRRRSNSGMYELFRDRLIFPIRNISGAVVGFGGRMFSDDEPKYINSPETDVYKKGETLYGLYEARDAIRQARSVVIVEGYLDLLQVAQSGILNVVATLGTAMTDGQAALVRRFAESAVLVYDGDDAGIKAAERGMAVLAKSGIEPRVVLLPEGNDPDDFVRQHGKDGFCKIMDQAVDMLDFVLRDSRDESLSPNAKSAVAGRAFTIIAAISDTIKQSEYLRLLADRLKVSETSVRREFTRHRRRQRDAGSATTRTGPKWADVTIDLVRALIKHPEYIEQARADIDLSMMNDGPEKELFTALFQHDGTDTSAEHIFDKLQSDGAQSLMSRILVEQTDESEDIDRALFEGWIYKMRIHILRRRMADINTAIVQAQQNHDEAQLTKLLHEHAESGKLLSSLQNNKKTTF